METQKRLLLATVLSFLIFVGWSIIFKPTEKLAPAETPTTSSTISHDSSTPLPSLSGGKEIFPLATGGGGEDSIETGLYKGSLARRGGGLISFTLSRFQKHPLISEGKEAGLLLVCEGCNFNLPVQPLFEKKSSSPGEVVYEWSSPELLLRRIYRFSEGKYLIDLGVEIEGRKPGGLTGKLGLAWVGSEPENNSGGFLSFLKGPPDLKGIVYLAGGRLVHQGVEKEGVNGTDSGLIAWAGLEDRYFIRTLISRGLTQEQPITYSIDKNSSRLTLYTPPFAIPASGGQAFQFSAYLGPKQMEPLRELGISLDKTIDYGMLSFLALPILYLLKFFHNFVPNWGIAIILLTIFVKILLNPLTLKGLRQMKQMQKVQPELTLLREKYKGDKQRLNMETMNLFKRHKVNPLGGCLPMILQMPIYIALYKVLYSSIDLYQTPFFGFYKDLSAPDPYFILPIFLGLFMVLQQKLTPNPSADPTQARMMMLMPIMFTGFMVFLPVGLVLYILVNTVMSVLQQWMSSRDIRWRDLLRGRIVSRPA
ncbi:MAG: membrane protein insertase YidC [Deltaproteobacteria bacterium]|nr:membrane protein insertase YidC [Deltaproteobacteria bacterium]